jgi:hypothetical protein
VGEAIGESIVLALGLAVTSVPVVAIVLMLLEEGAGRRRLAFAAGWLVGTAAVLAAVIAASDALGTGPDTAPARWASIARIVLGAGLLGLAVVDWRKRPRRGEPTELPGWMRALGGSTVPRSAGLGLALATCNPKNLVLLLSGGLAIAGAPVGVAGEIVGAAVFVLVATAPVNTLVLLYRYLGAGPRRALDAGNAWIQTNNASVMAGLLLVIGAVLLVNGVAYL